MRTEATSRRPVRTTPLSVLLAVLALMLPLLLSPACAMAVVPPPDAVAAAHCHGSPETPSPDDPAGAEAPDCCPACAPAPTASPPVAPAPRSLPVASAPSRLATSVAARAFAPPCPLARGPPSI